MKPRILHIAPLSPIEPASGGAVRLAHTARALSEGFALEGIYGVQTRDTELPSRTEPYPMLFVPHLGERTFSSPHRMLDRGLRVVQTILLAVGAETVDFFSGVPATARTLAAERVAGAVATVVELGQWADVRPRSVPSVLVVYDLQWRKLQLRETYLRSATTDPHSTRLERMRTRAEVRALRRAEARRYARFDAVVTVSSEDSAALAQAWGGMRGRRPPLFVSRNGVDAAAFDMAAAGGTHGAIGFVGGLTHPPNADAIRELRERVEPALPESIERVLIAGDRTDELAPSGRLRGLGLVDDVRSVYRDVLLSLAPIRWGSGTRLKIIESVAARRPVVAYPEAAEGLEDLVATGAVRLVGSPEEMAVAAGDLVADPDERLRVAELGRSVVVEHYDWGVTLAGVLAAVEAVTSGGRR